MIIKNTYYYYLYMVILIGHSFLHFISTSICVSFFSISNFPFSSFAKCSIEINIKPIEQFFRWSCSSISNVASAKTSSMVYFGFKMSKSLTSSFVSPKSGATCISNWDLGGFGFDPISFLFSSRFCSRVLLFDHSEFSLPFCSGFKVKFWAKNGLVSSICS